MKQTLGNCDSLVYHCILEFLDIKTLLLPICKYWYNTVILLPEIIALKSQDYKVIWKTSMIYERLAQYYYTICMDKKLLIPIKEGFYQSCLKGKSLWIKRFIDNPRFKGESLCNWSERSWMWDKAFIASVISGNEEWIEYFFSKCSNMSRKIGLKLSKYGFLKEALYVMCHRHIPVSFSITEKETGYSIDHWMTLLTTKSTELENYTYGTILTILFTGISRGKNYSSSHVLKECLPILLKHAPNFNQEGAISAFIKMLISRNISIDIIRKIYLEKGDSFIHPECIIRKAIVSKRLDVITELIGPIKRFGYRLRYAYKRGDMDEIKKCYSEIEKKDIEKGKGKGKDNKKGKGKDKGKDKGKETKMRKKDIYTMFKKLHWDSIKCLIDHDPLNIKNIVIFLLSRWMDIRESCYCSYIIAGTPKHRLISKCKDLFIYIMNKYPYYKIENDLIFILKEPDLVKYTFSPLLYKHLDTRYSLISSYDFCHFMSKYTPKETFYTLCKNDITKLTYGIMKGDVEMLTRYITGKYSLDELYIVLLTNIHYNMILYISNKYPHITTALDNFMIYGYENFSRINNIILDELTFLM